MILSTTTVYDSPVRLIDSPYFTKTLNVPGFHGLLTAINGCIIYPILITLIGGLEKSTRVKDQTPQLY